MTYARKVDRNHREVIQALRRCGWLVMDTSGAGRGVPDLVVWHRGRTQLLLVEVKAPQGKPTPAQLRYSAAGWPIVTVRSVDDAIAL